MLKNITKFLGGSNEGVIKGLFKDVEEINALEPEFERMADNELMATRDVFKARLASGEDLDDILPEAFAAVREASKRTLGMRHFDAQIEPVHQRA